MRFYLPIVISPPSSADHGVANVVHGYDIGVLFTMDG